MYGTRPTITNCTNAWISGKGLDDIRESIMLRGNDDRFFYNCFCRINGAEDKLTYANELFKLQQELKNSKRNLVIVNEEIPKTDTAGDRRDKERQLCEQRSDDPWTCGDIQYTGMWNCRGFCNKHLSMLFWRNPGEKARILTD